MSDKVITQESGILQLVEFGDQIMAYRGFNVGDDLAMCGAELLLQEEKSNYQHGRLSLPDV